MKSIKKQVKGKGNSFTHKKNVGRKLNNKKYTQRVIKGGGFDQEHENFINTILHSDREISFIYEKMPYTWILKALCECAEKKDIFDKVYDKKYSKINYNYVKNVCENTNYIIKNLQISIPKDADQRFKNTFDVFNYLVEDYYPHKRKNQSVSKDNREGSNIRKSVEIVAFVNDELLNKLRQTIYTMKLNDDKFLSHVIMDIIRYIQHDPKPKKSTEFIVINMDTYLFWFTHRFSYLRQLLEQLLKSLKTGNGYETGYVRLLVEKDSNWIIFKRVNSNLEQIVTGYNAVNRVVKKIKNNRGPNDKTSQSYNDNENNGTQLPPPSYYESQEIEKQKLEMLDIYNKFDPKQKMAYLKHRLFNDKDFNRKFKENFSKLKIKNNYLNNTPYGFIEGKEDKEDNGDDKKFKSKDEYVKLDDISFNVYLEHFIIEYITPLSVDQSFRELFYKYYRNIDYNGACGPNNEKCLKETRDDLFSKYVNFDTEQRMVYLKHRLDNDSIFRDEFRKFYKSKIQDINNYGYIEGKEDEGPNKHIKSKDFYNYLDIYIDNETYLKNYIEYYLREETPFPDFKKKFLTYYQPTQSQGQEQTQASNSTKIGGKKTNRNHPRRIKIKTKRNHKNNKKNKNKLFKMRKIRNHKFSRRT